MGVDIQMHLVRGKNGRLGLVPANIEAEHELSEMKVKGGLVRARLTATRSNPNNARFHAMLAVVLEALSGDPEWTYAKLKKTLKRKCGLYEEWTDEDGVLWREYDSVAFDKMDEIDFSAFCRRAEHVIITEILPGVEQDDLVREIEGYMGIRKVA